MSDTLLPEGDPAGLSDFDPMDNPAFADLVRESSDRLRRLKGKPSLTASQEASELAVDSEPPATRRFG